MESAVKTRENGLRRLAARLGYRIERSRARAMRSNEPGEYRLVEMARNLAVDGAGYDASLDRIEARLNMIARQIPAGRGPAASAHGC